MHQWPNTIFEEVMGQKFSLSLSGMMKPPSTTNNLEVRKQPVTYNAPTQRTKKHKKINIRLF
jgi:hypothetical protein